jgi:hypothetical protein
MPPRRVNISVKLDSTASSLSPSFSVHPWAIISNSVIDWGTAVTLPPLDGAATLAVKVKVVGSGAGFSFELRARKNNSARLFAFGIDKSRLTFWLDGKRKRFGKVTPGDWFEISIVLPAPNGAAAVPDTTTVAAPQKIKITLTNLSRPTEVVTTELGYHPPAPEEFARFFVNVTRNMPKFSLYLDDFTLTKKQE